MVKHFLHTLDNGLKILILHNKKAKITTFNMSLKVGSDIETLQTLETGHFLEHLFSLYTSTKYPNGAANREYFSMNNIDEEAEITSKNILFGLEFKDKYIDKVIDIVSHCLKDFKCDKKMFIQEKNSVIEELNAIINETNYKFETKIDSVIYKGHSRAISQDKRLKNCLKITPSNIEAFYRKYFIPSNIVISFYTSTQPTALFNKIKKNFQNIPSRPSMNYPCYKYKFDNSNQIVYLKKNNHVSNLKIYYRIPYTFFDDEYYPIYALLKILGSDLNSLLFKKLRSEEGLIYDIDADMELDKVSKDLSFIEISTSMDSKNLIKVFQIILNILNDVKKDIPKQYILKYIDSIKINKLQHEFCQNPRKLLIEYTDYILWDKKLISVQKEFKNFSNVHLNSLKKIANIIFSNQNIHICYDGKINYDTQIRKILDKY